MHRRNASHRQLPSSSVESRRKVQPVPSISPAAALSLGISLMSGRSNRLRWENTKPMGNFMWGAMASNIPRTSGWSRRIYGFFSSASAIKAAIRMTGIMYSVKKK